MGENAYVAEMICTASNFAPQNTAFCFGQLLLITNNNAALFSISGTMFGGDGRETFGLPDMRGRTAVGFGQGPGLTNVNIGDRRGAEAQPVPVPEHTHAAKFTPSGSSGTTTQYTVEGSITQPNGSVGGDATLNTTSSTLSGTASVTGSAAVKGTTPVTLDGALYVNNDDGDFTDPQNNGALARAVLGANTIKLFDAARATGDVPAGHVEVSGDIPATGKTVDGSDFGIDTSGLSVSVAGNAQTDGLVVTVPDPDYNLFVDIQSSGGTVTVSDAGVSDPDVSTIPPQLGINWYITVDGDYPSRP